MVECNLFADLPQRSAGESFKTLLKSSHVRIERIVSSGQASPEGFWYDQPQHEWVAVLSGAARLRMEGVDEPIELYPGDYLEIASHCRHRVEWTTPEEPTLWLAVHFDGQIESDWQGAD